MDMNRFTEKAQEALSGAQGKATRLSHQQVAWNTCSSPF